MYVLKHFLAKPLKHCSVRKLFFKVGLEPVLLISSDFILYPFGFDQWFPPPAPRSLLFTFLAHP